MSSVNDLIQHVESAFERAEKKISKLNDHDFKIHGMTGEKTRHFYNNLLDRPDSRYLEIGTWQGSSVCSAMYKNKANVVCIDDWSEFSSPDYGDVRGTFLKNFHQYKGENNAYFLESNCFHVNVSQLPKFNIYMYDGNHSHDSHYRALVHFYNCLDDIFIFIVDDWNWQQVRDGTFESFQKLNLKILYQKEVRLTTDNSHSPSDIGYATWHNGIYVAILQKQS